MRLSEVLRQFASEAPWIQVEVQRTAAELCSRLEAHLLAAERSKGGELTEERRAAVRELARQATPSFCVPAMNATVRLELATVTRRGWLLRKRSESETTDFSIEMTLEAAPLGPLAAMPELLPATPEALAEGDELTREEVEQGKRLMAGAPAADGRPGERVELVAQYLTSPASNWADIWRGGEAAYGRLVADVAGPEWTDGYRRAMQAILRRALLLEGLETSGHGRRMRDYIRHLEAPTWRFLRHLREMKYIQDRLILGE